ncbi:microtubule-associated protein futsch-like isoform X1 [Odontomachus brunneus]|uniref:microtubule-associated protein futsch-like isoform X1 n=1 Tax=Odontomachus brunneus TaxID=486640 RepID=UPI0013F2486C|nr:microtubule-associated protein futsch-like isoform X1 [Odontomachus brunneus]
MPYYNDVPHYYGVSYANHSSLMTGTGRPFTPISRFSPHLSTISESPLSHLHRFSPIVRHPRRVIDTADIDVSSPRILSHDGNRPRNRLRRDRPTIKIRSQALKDNPMLRQHNERHEKSVGELLMEKFLIKDKKSSSDGQQQPVRLYHQISLDSLDESAQDREALQKRVTRRLTRRRSSTDLQLDPEQLQREATYAQVQAKLLDSLVAEEQAQIESEVRRGTLIRKGTVRGPMNGHSYYSSHSGESDTMTREEEEEALRMRKTTKKTKRKKKPTDKPSPPDKADANDHTADDRRLSSSSELSTDSKIEEEEDSLEENGPRPQMYKIEACNSAGDFSTIWVNASENEPQHKLNVDQFRESVRVPIPKKPGSSGTHTIATAKKADEAETQVVLPVRKLYVKDPSRNSVYLTLKKPLEKLCDEKLDARLETNAEEAEDERLANGFVEASTNRILQEDGLKSSKCDNESSKLHDEVGPADDVKDVMFKKTAGKLRKVEESLTKKKDVRVTPRSLDVDVDDGDSRVVKRDTVILKMKDDEVRETDIKAESPKSIETTNASSISVESGVSTCTQTKQLEASKDTPDVKVKKDNESRKNEVAIAAAKKNLEATTAVKTSKALVSSKDAPSTPTRKNNEDQRNESTIGVKKNLETMVKTSKSSASSKDVISAATKKDNENQKNESATGAAKKNLEATTVKTSEALTLSKDAPSMTTKKDDESQKNESAINATKNLEAIPTTKTQESVISSKNVLSANMKDNENQKDESAIGATKKNLGVVIKKDNENPRSESMIGTTKKSLETVPITKTQESAILSKDALSATTKKDNKNQRNVSAMKGNLETVSTAKTKTSESPTLPKDVFFTKKDNENAMSISKKDLEIVPATKTKTLEGPIPLKGVLSTKKDNENAMSISKKDLETVPAIKMKTSEGPTPLKGVLSTKKDNENMMSISKKDLETVPAVKTKTSESPTPPKDVLSTKRDNENALGISKKDLETIPAAKTKMPESPASFKDVLSTKKNNENAMSISRKDLETAPVIKMKMSEGPTPLKGVKGLNENVMGISKKDLKPVSAIKTKTSEVPASPKDASLPKKDNESRKNEIAIGGTKKILETATKPKTPEALAALRTDKLAEEEAQGTSAAPKILAMSHEDVRTTTTAERSVSTYAGDTRENSASIATMPTPSAASLPKASKINADRNNAVEAPELSLREAAAYLPAESSANKSERHVTEVDVVGVAALPGKKADKAWNLAKKSASALDVPPKKANGVNEAGELARGHRDDTAKSKCDETTLPEGTSGEVRSNETTKAGNVKLTRDVGLTKTPGYKTGTAARELSAEATSSSIAPARSEAKTTVLGTDASEAAKPSKVDVKKVSALVDAEEDSSRDSGVSSPKDKVSKTKFGGAESKFPFKIRTLQKTSEVGKDSSTSKATSHDDGKAPTAARRDANAPRVLKKSTSVDPLKSTSDFSPANANIFSKTLQQSVSVDEKTTGKSMPVKKLLEPTKLPSKATEKKLDVSCEKSQVEPSGQLSKSASTESIDFWSEIKAPESPRATRSKQSAAPPSNANAVSSKIEEKADPISGPKWASSESAAKPSATTAAIKEPGEKKNESAVKISVAPGATAAVAPNDVAEARRPKERAVVPPVEATRSKAEVEKGAQQQTKAPRAKRKNNLSIAIDKDSTVKKAPTKREDSAISSQPEPNTATSNTSSEESTPLAVPEITVPLINIIEVPKLSGSDGQSADHEDYEDVSTPTNELADPALAKISKWSHRDDLTATDDAETPVVSEEASLAASPAISPQSSKTKHAVKKKKPSSKKPSTKSDKETAKRASSESTTTTSRGEQSTLVVKPQQTDQQLRLKPSLNGSPRNSPRNSPSQRPLDLIKMFYTTPSALLTATPRDLTKIRRAKIKRRRHHSRTPSVSSDSTGSTTSSTATTESTDGSVSTCTELDDEAEHKRMNSTRSNDSGFDGSPRISTPSQSSDNQRNSDSSDHFPSGRITPPATNLPRFKKYAVTDFNFLKVLGKGSFGKVLLAELRGTECAYAVKCLKKDVVLEDDDVECTLIERKVLTLATRHPYLCHLFCTFQTDSHLFFVMEYLNGGDLMFHIQKSGRFPESRARFYAAEIWSGLNFLHKKGIVYRDLKLDNVLLDFDGHIRIADFGMCKLQIFLDRTADTFCGTPDYMAPEIIKGLKYNQAVDWWSYGVLLYEMLTGQSPFSGCDEDELFWSICNERPFIPRYLSQDATDMLVCLLEKDSGKRPPGHEIAMHAFFQHLPWDRLERRQLEPPFKPALDHTLDTRYFDTAFTTERPRLTPVPEQILTSMDQGVFRGFSYTNPNATD